MDGILGILFILSLDSLPAPLLGTGFSPCLACGPAYLSRLRQQYMAHPMPPAEAGG